MAIETIKFSQMTNAGNINNNDIMPSLRSGLNVTLNNPWTFLPSGTTAQRPTPSSTVNFRLRFNTDDQLYEYYDAVLGSWTQLQENTFTVGPFITYTAAASLPDAQNLGALADGILRQTITSGSATLNIAVNGTDYYGPGFVIPGTDGGTGVNNGALTINLSSATLGYVLTSDSSGNATWQSVSASGGITTIDGDSGAATPLAGVVTITGGSTGLTFTGSSHTLSLDGLLNTTFGGLGVSNPTAHGVLVGEGASAVNPIVLGAGQILIGTTSGDPVAAAINSGTNILVGNSSGSITIGITGVISPTNGGTGVNNGSNTLTLAGNHTLSGAFASTFTMTNTTNVTFPTSGTLATISQLPTPAALTSTNDTNVTLTLGGSPTVALLAATSLTLGWTGTLAVGRGGTGVSSVTIVPTATAFAGWDANKNFSANNLISAYATTPTAGGTTTLTVGSAQSQYFTGTLSQTIQMPVANTLVLGQYWTFVNLSSGTLTIQSSGGNTITTVGANSSTYITCILASGTSAASWSAETPAAGSGVVNSGTINNLAYYAANGSTVSSLATANNGVLVTSNTGAPSISTTLPSGLTIPSPIISTGLYDPNNNLWVQQTYQASAVNYLNITNSATTLGIGISVSGSDTNITLSISGKGTGPAQIKGISSGLNVSTGYVGEYISSNVASGSAVSISNNSATTITSIPLTAGDWDVSANIWFAPAAGTLATYLAGGISLTNNSFPTAPAGGAAVQSQQTFGAGLAQGYFIGTTRINVSAPTNVYLVGFAQFTTSTMAAYGFIGARRAC